MPWELDGCDDVGGFGGDLGLGGDGVPGDGDLHALQRLERVDDALDGLRCLVFLGQWWKEYCFER